MFLQNYINNIAGLQLFQLLRFSTLLLINVVFAKSKLSTEAIGNYELFLFITALFSSFWINSLIQSLLPLYKDKQEQAEDTTKSPKLFNAFILITGFSFITILILIIFHNPISSVLTESDTIPFFSLILIYIFFSNPSFLIEYIYLLKNKPGSIIAYGVITFTAQLILVSAPVLLGAGLNLALSGLLIITIARYCWLWVLLKQYARFNLSLNFIKEHLKYAWPLIISTLLGSSANYVDGFLVLNNFDSATFAVFRYGAKEFPLVLLLANALSTAMIPEFSQKDSLKHSLSILRKKSEGLMHLLFPVTILFLIFSHWLYPLIFNPNFRESATIFNIYLLLTISRLIFPHTIIIGQKRTNIIMYASFVELLVNISLSIAFIGIWGIEGIALATVIAFAIQKIIWLIYNKMVLDISPKEYISLNFLAFYSITTLVVFGLTLR